MNDNNTSNELSNPDDTWYCQKDGRDVGPFGEADLVSLIESGLLKPETTLVRGDGKQVRAADLGLFAGNTPNDKQPAAESPSPPPLPDAATRHESDSPFGAGWATADSHRLAYWKQLCEIARRQRMLNIAALIGILLVGGLIQRYPIVNLPVTIVWAYLIAKLATSLGSSPWLYGVFALVPLLNLCLVLDLSRRATGILKYQGVRVGLLGTTLPTTPPASFTMISPHTQ